VQKINRGKVFTWGDSSTLSSPGHREARTNDKTDKFYFYNISVFNANLYDREQPHWNLMSSLYSTFVFLFGSFSMDSTYIFCFIFLIWITSCS